MKGGIKRRRKKKKASEELATKVHLDSSSRKRKNNIRTSVYFIGYTCKCISSKFGQKLDDVKIGGLW